MADTTMTIADRIAQVQASAAKLNDEIRGEQEALESLHSRDMDTTGLRAQIAQRHRALEEAHLTLAGLKRRRLLEYRSELETAMADADVDSAAREAIVAKCVEERRAIYERYAEVEEKLRLALQHRNNAWSARETYRMRLEAHLTQNADAIAREERIEAEHAR